MDAEEESFRKADSGSIQHGDCLGIENIQTREKQAEEQVAKGNWGTANPGTSSPDSRPKRCRHASEAAPARALKALSGQVPAVAGPSQAPLTSCSQCSRSQL